MKKRPTHSRGGVKGGAPLRGQGAERPCGVWGNAPTVPRATNSKEEVNQGAGSEASLPVTSRSRRSAPKLLFRPTMLCRARWARPSCWCRRHSGAVKQACFLPQAGDFASAEATRGQWKRTKFAVAPLTPSPCTFSYLIFIVAGGIAPAGATKGLSDRPLETFGALLCCLIFTASF